jgi:hypothetical protein
MDLRGAVFRLADLIQPRIFSTLGRKGPDFFQFDSQAMAKRTFGSKFLLEQLFRFIERLFIPSGIIHQGTKHRLNGRLGKQSNLLDQVTPAIIGGYQASRVSRRQSDNTSSKRSILKERPSEASAKSSRYVTSFPASGKRPPLNPVGVDADRSLFARLGSIIRVGSMRSL